MKKVLFFLVIGVFFSSCSQDKDILSEMPNFLEEQGSSLENDKKIIESMGFDISDLVDYGTFYLVEGDIKFNKEDLILTKQAKWSELISYPNQRRIKVRIDNSLPSSGVDNWQTEIGQAINHWNNIDGCNIKMQLVTSNQDILIKNDGGTLADNVLANASFPSNGKPGPTIDINLDFYSNTTMTSSQKVYNMVHELGHCLGLRHTNWSGRNEYPSGIGIEGTPNTGSNPDPNSVMNGGTALNSWNGFSSYDIIAIKELYPDLVSQMAASASLTGFPTSIELNKPCAIHVSGSFPGPVTYKWIVGGGNLVGDDFRSYVNTIPTNPYTFNVDVVITNQYGDDVELSQVIGGTLRKYLHYKYQ